MARDEQVRKKQRSVGSCVLEYRATGRIVDFLTATLVA